MNHDKAVTVNRQYKSTMFALLFRDKKELLDLYNAVNASHYTDLEALQIVTLENAIYMNMKNDLAFVIDMRLNLYEHQSTYNPNMPLRDLFYVAKEYQIMVQSESIYASTLVKIPAPRFLVFYNGLEERPEREVLKLSNAYFTKETEPRLELIVTVLNINTGNNKDILERCRTLNEYMQYVGCVRRHLAGSEVSLEHAVEKAVNECIENGILADFLRKNKAEAISVSIFEYNEAEEKEKLRKAEYLGGYDDGVKQGIEQGKDMLLKSMVEKKLQKGKTPEEIAEDLEEDLTKVERVCRMLKQDKITV